MDSMTSGQPRLAKRTQSLKASALREIFKAIAAPDVISFAGGLPAMDSFPALSITPDSNVLQYGSSEGSAELRELIAQKLSKDGLNTTSDKILILSGSQQGIDLVAKLCIENQTNVAVESPTYLAALQAFTLFGARYNPFSFHENPDQTKTLRFENANETPNLLYTVPTFNNPSTHVYTQQERQAIATNCETNNTILFEDDPYRDICFSPCCRTPISSLIKNGTWIYQSTFSKTVAPGLRIGYLTCSDNLFEKLLHLKQAADLHSCNLSQQILCQYLRSADSLDRAEKLSAFYKVKRDLFEEQLNHYFGHLAQWSLPKGGLFYWIKLTNSTSIDLTELLERSLKSGVAFMPGDAFYVNGKSAEKRIRLNFSHATEQQMQRGLQLLAQQIEQ